MKLVQTKALPSQSADRRLVIHGVTLIALGLSVLFLNSWDNLFVRASVGFFWAAFVLIANWHEILQTLGFLRKLNDRQRRSAESVSVGR